MTVSPNTEDFLKCQPPISKEFLLVSDWRKDQAASKRNAAIVALQFSDDLMQRISISQVSLYVIDKKLVIECPSAADVHNLSTRLGADIRAELVATKARIREIEFWHELTATKYVTPVQLT